jgi:hypothetical protein
MPLGDTKLRELAWCAARTVCATVSKTERLSMDFTTDRYEAFYTALLPLDGSKVRWLFKDAHSVAPAIMGNYGFRTVGGKHLGYFGALQLREAADRTGYEFDKGQPALFAVDMATLSFRKIGEATDEGSSREWLIGVDGQLAARFDFTSNTGSWTIRSKSGLTLAHGRDKLADVGFVALGKDGTSPGLLAAGPRRRTDQMVRGAAGRRRGNRTRARDRGAQAVHRSR